MDTATVIYEGALRTRATHLLSGTSIVTDAPPDNQGKGEAFSPTDLVATALCSCMLTIMGIAAPVHGFSIDGAKARVHKIMASDPRRIAEVIIDIEFPDFPYSEKHRQVLRYCADNCPVAKSLSPNLKQTVNLHFKH